MSKEKVFKWLEHTGNQEEFTFDEKIALLDMMIDNYVNISDKDTKDLREAREQLLIEKILLSDD